MALLFCLFTGYTFFVVVYLQTITGLLAREGVVVSAGVDGSAGVVGREVSLNF